MCVPPPFSYEKIDALLLTVACELPRRPDWYARLARLDASASAEKRLPVYQAIRDDGCLPEDAGFFLVSYAFEDLSLEVTRRLTQIDDEVARQMEEDPESFNADNEDSDLSGFGFDVDDEFESVDDDSWSDDDDAENDHGNPTLEDDVSVWEDHNSGIWNVPAVDVDEGSRPRSKERLPAWLMRRFLGMWDRRLFKNLTAHGEREIAELFKHYVQEFKQRRESGRQYFFKPPQTGAAALRAAMQELYDHVRQCVGSRLPIGPLACRWSVDCGFVDLQIFPTPLELVGGPQDGAIVNPDVDFDVLRIQQAFESLDGVSWALDGEDREDQHVCFRGGFHGHEVWLTVFAGAPEGEKPTMKSDELRKWRALRGDSSD